MNSDSRYPSICFSFLTFRLIVRFFLKSIYSSVTFQSCSHVGFLKFSPMSTFLYFQCLYSSFPLKSCSPECIPTVLYIQKFCPDFFLFNVLYSSIPFQFWSHVGFLKFSPMSTLLSFHFNALCSSIPFQSCSPVGFLTFRPQTMSYVHTPFFSVLSIAQFLSNSARM
jgi:hypothetical protein